MQFEFQQFKKHTCHHPYFDSFQKQADPQLLSDFFKMHYILKLAHFWRYFGSVSLSTHLKPTS